jgi:hypothetical protein
MDYSADHEIIEENDLSMLLLDGIVIQGEIPVLVCLLFFVLIVEGLNGLVSAQ